MIAGYNYATMNLRTQRTTLLLLLLWLFLGSCVSAPQELPQEESQDSLLPWTPAAWVEGQEVVFQFDPRLLLEEGRERPHKVALAGTFTSWTNSDSLLLEYNETTGLWTGRFPLESIDVPGNSGMPEFQFVLEGANRISATVAPPGHCWGTNFVVHIPPESPASLEEKALLNRQALDNPQMVPPDILGNFRMLTGGNLGDHRLFRSYHPFTPSKGGEAETLRLKAVQTLMEEKGIQGVINLTDTSQISSSARMPAYYKTLADQGKVAFIVTDYNTVYYHPEGQEFRNQAKEILTFVAKNPGPYLVHCRLGTDRTGMVSALLQALTGVDWPGIAADYELSNRMMIREYRSVRLLEYAWKKMLGRHPRDISDLSGAVKTFLLESGLPQADLDQAVRHLQRGS